MSFVDLPVEVLCMVDELLTAHDMLNCAKTCWLYYHNILPIIFRKHKYLALEVLPTAIENGNKHLVQTILSSSPDIAQLNHLSLAVDCNRYGIISTLAELQSVKEDWQDFEGLDDSGNNPLTLAIERGFSDATRLLLNQLEDGDASFTNPDPNGNTPLSMACRIGNVDLVVDLVKRLLRCGSTEVVHSSLMNFCFEGNEEAFEFLIKQGASLAAAITWRKETSGLMEILAHGIEGNKLHIVQALINTDHFASEVDKQNHVFHSEGDALSHFFRVISSPKISLEITQTLLNCFVNITTTADEQGWLWIKYAIYMDNSDLVKLILHFRKDLDGAEQQRSLLDEALRWGSSHVARLLFDMIDKTDRRAVIEKLPTSIRSYAFKKAMPSKDKDLLDALICDKDLKEISWIPDTQPRQSVEPAVVAELIDQGQTVWACILFQCQDDAEPTDLVSPVQSMSLFCLLLDVVAGSAADGHENIINSYSQLSLKPYDEYEGMSPLHRAVINGDQKTLKTLLNNGEDPNVKWKETELGSIRKQARPFSDSGIPRPDTDPITQLYEFTPLFLAIYKGSNEMVELLLQHNADSDLDCDTVCPLVEAAFEWGRNPRIMKLLLEAGADPNRGAQSVEPLAVVCRLGHVDAAEVLVDRGAIIEAIWNKRFSPGGSCLIDEAAYGGHKKMVMWLFDREAADDSQSTDWCNVLESAIQGCKPGMLRFLVESDEFPGFDMFSSDRLIRLLQTAVDHGNHEAVQYLLAKSVGMPKDAMSRIHIVRAAGKGYNSMIKLLLSHGADINLPQDINLPWPSGARTPLDHAASRGCLRSAKYLLRHGASISNNTRENFPYWDRCCGPFSTQEFVRCHRLVMEHYR